MLFEEFARELELPLRSWAGRILVHGHCHQKSMGLLPATVELLSRIPSATIIDLDAGCCGMAGGFGMEAGKFALSQAVGERVLLPAVRRASPETLIVADGFSCREQIAQATGRHALHLAEAIQLALHRQNPRT